MRGLSKKLKTGSCLFLPRLHAPLFYIEFRRRVSRVTVSGIELHTHTKKPTNKHKCRARVLSVAASLSQACLWVVVCSEFCKTSSFLKMNKESAGRGMFKQSCLFFFFLI